MTPTGMTRFAGLLISLAALALGACESAPIKVGPRPDIKAFRVQNETTKKEIRSFSETNKKTQVHVKKVQEEAVQEATALQTARKYLAELLGEDQ